MTRTIVVFFERVDERSTMTAIIIIIIDNNIDFVFKTGTGTQWHLKTRPARRSETPVFVKQFIEETRYYLLRSTVYGFVVKTYTLLNVKYNKSFIK